jgi:hypothetical protein
MSPYGSDALLRGCCDIGKEDVGDLDCRSRTMFAEPPKVSAVWARLPQLAPALCATGVSLTEQEAFRGRLNLHKRR